MRAGSDLATSLSKPSSPTFTHPSFSLIVSGPTTFERSLPFALYQQYTSFSFFLLNHPLAIGLLLPATGTAGFDNTALARVSGWLFGDNRFRKLRKPEAPHLPLALPDRMGGDLAGTRHLQHTAAGDAQEFCGSVGIHKRLILTHQSSCCALPRTTGPDPAISCDAGDAEPDITAKCDRTDTERRCCQRKSSVFNAPDPELRCHGRA